MKYKKAQNTDIYWYNGGGFIIKTEGTVNSNKYLYGGSGLMMAKYKYSIYDETSTMGNASDEVAKVNLVEEDK